MSLTDTETEAPLTRDEIAEAIAGHRATMERMPAHWTDRRAALGEIVDDLVLKWLAAPA